MTSAEVGRVNPAIYGDSSQPLPAFVTTDAVVNRFQGGITIDGLHLEGSTGHGSMGGMGVCVTLGGNSQLLNSEITDCDIGIMLFGDNGWVQGNVVYDLNRMAVDSTDAAISASNNLIAEYDPGVGDIAGTTADAFDLLPRHNASLGQRAPEAVDARVGAPAALECHRRAPAQRTCSGTVRPGTALATPIARAQSDQTML